MEDILVAVLSMLLIVALVPLYLWRRRQNSLSPGEHEDEAQVERRETVVRATGARQMRRRPASSAAAAVDETVDGSDDETAGDGYYTAKSSNKKEKKRQEQEAQRQAEEAARESKQTKQSHYDDMRRRKEEDCEAKERALTHKCVPLEDLAAEFKLRTQECINRINSLEEMGRLSGVMDDRGKYIYISLEEMNAVAEYIKRVGRVSITHLAGKSNQFIDLEPKTQVVEDRVSLEEIAAA
ncbi:hypothetical protein R3W88_020764 [Solanum pinnatisectum]|uniref:DDRGK domain-containing protein 1 n=1 Tax=Solanum pinnatisectum TaxID=50273 RepID=A0AAV9KP92_9SOLN|nr:hypothetical protein R3W88_020764 [Solanum pinnatisectum]